MCEFSLFNQISLNLLNVWNALHDNIWVVYTFDSFLLRNMFETSIKLTKILL